MVNGRIKPPPHSEAFNCLVKAAYIYLGCVESFAGWYKEKKSLR